MKYRASTWKLFYAMREVCLAMADGRWDQRDIVRKVRTDYNIIATISQVNYVMTRTRHDPVFGGKFRWGMRGVGNSGYTFIEAGGPTDLYDQYAIQQDIDFTLQQARSLRDQCQMMADGIDGTAHPTEKTYWQNKAGYAMSAVQLLILAAA